MNNTVELRLWCGSDEYHAEAAWESTGGMTEEKRGRIKKLLCEILAGHDPKHTVPFEHSFLSFRVTVDLATHIHMLKHRIGVSISSQSARYKEIKDGTYWIPRDWDEKAIEWLSIHYNDCEQMYHDLVHYLTPTLGRQRAKESARFVLPYGHQITSTVSFNFLSFMHFQKLRNDPSAQAEVREIANRMLELVRETGAFPLSLDAWGY